MFRRPHYIALGLVALLVLIILNLPNQTATQIKLALGGLFLPLFGLTGSGQNLLEKAGNALIPRRHLLQQIDQLRSENEQLRVQAMQGAPLWQENNRLRQALAWQKQTPWQRKLGRVVIRDPANWWRTLQIDLGGRDGVITNQPVLTADGLVGRIDQVGRRHSRVVLIGDPNCRVSALVVETRDSGMIVPASSGLLDESLVNLTYLPNRSAIKPGQKVITSGLDGIFPNGITIGQIVDTNSVGFGLYTEARVKLAANLGHLEEVWVLFP
ncbi:MAG: rod shape-determining protein MreC [Chloroflexi bacterium]|nr:rod shape-determining protein MreC [Chloroflexota bacterium]